MHNRLMLLALASLLLFSLAACGPAPEPAPAEPEPAASAPATPAPPAVMYELTSDDITTHPDWTSANVTILGAKLGDRTNDVIKNFGEQDNTRTLPEEYLTVYQRNGLFVYTFKLTGRIRRFEVYETMAAKVKDENLKKLLTGGDLAFMRMTFGMEEKAEENVEDMSTEYVYDAKGFRFVKYNVSGKTVNAIRFVEVKKPSAT
jgi:hypothetical protein